MKPRKIKLDPSYMLVKLAFSTMVALEDPELLGELFFCFFLLNDDRLHMEM